jgi:hypothetical protein
MYVCVVVLGKYFLLCDGPESPAPDLAFRWGPRRPGEGAGDPPTCPANSRGHL